LAEAVCRDLPSWRERVVAFAVDKLLPLKNQARLEPDEISSSFIATGNSSGAIRS
jgi:hypothetical protein